MNDDSREFRPDWSSPTGVTVAECMRIHGVSREQLSCHLGEEDNEFVDALLVGEAVVGPETAKGLSAAFGGSVGFWLMRDGKYWQARNRIEGGRWVIIPPM